MSGPDIGNVIEKLIPKFWPFFIQLLAFLILFTAVFFLAYKPVKNFLKKRNDYIKKNIDEAKKNELLSIDKLNEAEASLNKSYKQAKEIVNQAKIDANKERMIIISKAKEDAKLEKLKAKKEIENEIKQSEDKIHQEMVNIAMLASEKILEREVNAKDNKRRINNFIKDIQSN